MLEISKKRIAGVLLAVFVICVLGFGSVVVAGDPVKVAVSIVPQATFVEAVAGKYADVVILVPPGRSPGNYEPTPREMQDLSDALVYFSIGVPTEAANILARLDSFNPSLSVVSLADAAAEVYPDREIAPGRRDPHVWLSPRRVMVMVETIADSLAELDPDRVATYRENAQHFIEELEALDVELDSILSQLTARKFIVYHPAFGYFADDYGLEMVALEQGGKEATPQVLQAAVDLAKEEGIQVIFYQKEIDSRQSRTFAEEIGGQAIQLAPLAPDYLDNLRRIASVFRDVL